MNTKKKRHIPDGYVKYSPKGEYDKGLFEVYVNNSHEKPLAMMFVKKQRLPKWTYRFKNTGAMDEYIIDYVGRLVSYEKMKKEKREKRKQEQKDLMQVGNILYASWGYEQTNIDFYQITEVKGKSFTIREISKKSIKTTSYCSDLVEPVKNSFIGDPVIKRSLKLKSYSYLSGVKEGESFHRSWGY